MDISRDNGYFKEAGVDVELVCCPGGTGEVSFSTSLCFMFETYI
jgi:hypothetical protein